MESARSATVAPPVIAPRALPVAPTARPDQPTLGAARRTPPSQSFALPFDERASIAPEPLVAAEATEVEVVPSSVLEAAPTPAPQPPRARPAQPIRPRSQDAPARVAPPPAAPQHRLDARRLSATLLRGLAQLAAIPATLPPLPIWLAAIAGAALLAWLAPPIAGAFLAGVALALAHRAEQPALRTAADGGRLGGADPRARVAEALGWGGLAASLAALALGLAFADGRGLGAPLPSSPLPWPPALLGPSALVGLAFAVAAGTRLAAARHAPFLAATAGPAMAVALIAAAGLRWGGVLVVSSGLVAAASWGCWQRYVARSLRSALTAWAAVGGVALVAAAVAIASGYRPLPVASALALGLLTTACVGATAQVARSYEDRQQRLARALAMLAAATLAAGLVLAGRALSLPLATCLALTPLAPVSAGVAALLQQRRAMLRIETSWLPRDARIAAGASLALVLASLPWPGAGANAWTLALALLGLSAFLSVQRALDGPVLAVAGAALLAIASVASGLAGLGVPLSWLSPAASLMIALIALACPRLPGRLTREAWTPVALVSLGACLIGSIAACALGEVAAGLTGAGVAALAPLALAGRRGIMELGHSLLAGHLPEGRRASTVAALQLGVVAFLPLAPLVALGLWPWAAPALAAEALLAALLSRWRPTLLHPAAWLVVGSGALLPLVAHPAGWLPGLVALGLLTVTGGLEFTSRGDASRGTHRSSAELLVGAGLGGVAWVGAGLSVAPVVLLAAAVCAQVLDALVSDALHARALRRASVVAWLAAILVGLGRAVIDPAQGAVLLGGSAVTGLLLFLLRRERWPLLVGGLSLAAAASCGLLLVGAPAGEHPTLHAASLAGVLIAWGTLESRRGARASEWLLLGLGTLAAALALEAHLPGSPGLLRAVAAIAGLGMGAAGFLSRHRVPLQVGAVLLAVELLWLAGQGAAWAVAHPAIGAGLLALVAAGIAGLAYLSI
jgi:hypothetical protein